MVERDIPAEVDNQLEEMHSPVPGSKGKEVGSVIFRNVE